MWVNWTGREVYWINTFLNKKEEGEELELKCNKDNMGKCDN